MKTGLLFVAVIAWAPGCATLLIGAPARPPVEAERLEPGGKGLFVVRPPATAECSMAVARTAGPPAQVACNAEYLLACDASAPADAAFCAVVVEKGQERQSIYPAARQ